MSNQTSPGRGRDMITGALILLAGIAIGRATDLDFASLLNPAKNSEGEVAEVDKNRSPDANSNNTDSTGQEDGVDSNSSSTGNRRISSEKLIESAPMEYLQSLPAARRICFMMERGADVGTAIKMNSQMGIAASGEIYEKNIPKPTAFSMDGLRVIGALERIKSDSPSDQDMTRAANIFMSASFNKAYQICPEHFMDSEVQELRKYFNSVDLG